MIPISPKSRLLPFAAEEFTWATFEDFFCAFLSAQPTLLGPNGEGVKVVKARPYGRKGDRQNGIDIKASMENGETWAFQCKHYPKSAWGPARTKKAIEACSFEAERKFLLVTREVSEKCHEVIREHPDWELWDSRQISSEFLRVDSAKGAEILYRHFGPGWPSAFFDLPTVLPLISAEARYFKLLEKGRRFHYRTPLVGRKEELKALHDFVRDKKSEVLLLPGRGGIGKSRLLLEFSRTFNRRHTDATILFVSDDANTSSDFARTIDALPKPLVLVFDDAHAGWSGDIRRALFPVLGKREGVKLVLAFRPGSTEQIRQELGGSPFEDSVIEERDPIPDLNGEEAMALAESAFGDALTEPARQVFARLAQESPLLVVMAAELRRSGELENKDIRDTREFRDHILSRGFETDIAPMFSRWGEETVRTFGKLVALLGPVSFDKEFLSACEEFFGKALRLDQISDLAEAFEDSGLLQESNGRARIVPDLLSDYLALDACYTRRGEDTAFVRRVMEKFDPGVFPRLVQHAAEAEWLANAKFPSADSVVAPLWEWFRERFKSSSFLERRKLLERWADIAHLQPERTVELASLAAELSEDGPADPQDHFWLRELNHHEQVVLGIPGLLSPLANSRPDFTARCLDLLWEIGKDRGLPIGTNHDDEHAIIAIAKICRFEYWKNAKIADVCLDWVSRKVREGSLSGNGNSPEFLFATLVKPFFSVVSELAWNRGDALMLGARLLSIPKTAKYRDATLALCREAARGGDLSMALGVVRVLGKAMRRLWIPYGNDPTPKQERDWLAERLKAVELAGHLVANWSDPLLLYRLRNALKHELTYSKSGDLKEAILPVFDLIEDTHELRLARVAFSYAHDEFEGDPEKEPDWYERAKRQWSDLLREVGDELVEKFPRPEHLLEELETFDRHAKAHGFSPNLGPLLASLSRNHSSIALEAVALILCATSDTNEVWLEHLLTEATANNLDQRLSLLREAIESGRPGLVASAIDCLAWWRMMDSKGGMPAAGWDLLFEASRQNADRVVTALLSFVRFNNHRPDSRDWRILEALAEKGDASPGGSLVRSAAELLKHGAEKPAPSLIARILETGLVRPSIDHAEVSRCLAYVANLFPAEVFLFFWRRVQRKKEEEDPRFSALPLDVEMYPFGAISDHPSIKPLLESFSTRILEGPDLEANEEKLLRAVVLHEDGVPILRKLIGEISTEEQCRRLVVLVARPFGRAVALMEPGFVRELLEKAKSFGMDFFEKSFHRLTILPGLRSSSEAIPDAEWSGLLRSVEKLAHQYADDDLLGPFYREIAELERAAMSR